MIGHGSRYGRLSFAISIEGVGFSADYNTLYAVDFGVKVMAIPHNAATHPE